MKKIFLLMILSVLIYSCTNQEHEFADFTETVYYPIQYPVRTLVLGESRLDNSIDLEHAFSVGVCVGGMYENKNNINVSFKVDPSLMNRITNVKVLPSDYYTIEPENNVVIPKGSFNGKVKVKLTDKFFDDPESYNGVYVLPLSLVNSSRGEILSGIAADGITSPNPNIAGDWTTRPKNFVLFAVKYINMLHGDFFMRGELYKNGELSQEYKTQDIEQGTVVNMKTNGYRQVLYTHTFNSKTYDIIVKFTDAVDGVGDVSFEAPEGASYSVSGSGKYYDKTTEFAKKYGAWLTDPNEVGKQYSHTTIVLDYNINGIEGNDYRYKDTLVFRNNDVVYEEFTPVIAQ